MPARLYKARILAEDAGVITVEIGFEGVGPNNLVVPDALRSLADLRLTGGAGIHFHGPASIPVAMALCHAVGHLYGYVACFDPKLQAYVVAVSHSPRHAPGDLIPLAAPGSEGANQ